MENKLSRRISTRDLVLIGLFSAIILIQTYTPLGYITIGDVAVTLIHITVIIAACILGTRLGTLIGLVWGITSFIFALQTPGLLNPLFYNPLISIVPRALVGFLAGLIFNLLVTKCKTPLSAGFAAVVGTLTNTILVLGGFYVFGYQLIFGANPVAASGGVDPVLAFIFFIAGRNGLLELAAAVIVVPLVVIPLKKLLK
ncbi:MULTISPECIES: ECF transporter S component [unclassified Granulicatella]|uniref:ECF transporter S component n=1 Tax=unclassified Granulicatella TaxID=2630493 RepID=UPI0010732356|nr:MULTISPECIES: ECF transporter S component [unclassified Granulicatella]MBF0781000.1 ECF transporter S component [Granulicatella sp. 19428wC4_WM01]TFU92716.1 ECF transporter S component [Granulicatella sp. WM01]